MTDASPRSLAHKLVALAFTAAAIVLMYQSLHAHTWFVARDGTAAFSPYSMRGVDDGARFAIANHDLPAWLAAQHYDVEVIADARTFWVAGIGLIVTGSLAIVALLGTIASTFRHIRITERVSIGGVAALALMLGMVACAAFMAHLPEVMPVGRGLFQFFGATMSGLIGVQMLSRHRVAAQSRIALAPAHVVAS